MAEIDDKLAQFATDKQWLYYSKSCELGSNRAAAKFFDVTATVVDVSVRSLKAKAAMAGYSPNHDMTRVAPEPFIVRGVSTYYNAEGKASGQWVKTKVDDSKLEEIVRNFVAELAEDIKGLAPMIPPPALTSDDILTVIPMGDPHSQVLQGVGQCVTTLSPDNVAMLQGHRHLESPILGVQRRRVKSQHPNSHPPHTSNSVQNCVSSPTTTLQQYDVITQIHTK